MSDFNYKRLTPFKWFILENFPFIEADFDALTNWQLFCKLGKEMNKIIDSENTLGTQVETLTDFVNNYFDNLDVQDEINNKLDEMAQDGTLQEIIETYLNTNAIICFNNVESLKNATNLINGSFVKTYGYYSINDMGSAFYKIRTITNTDIIDNATIISLNNFDNLVAELIINNELNIKQFGTKNDGITDDSAIINKAILFLSKNGGGTITAPKNTVSKILNPILLVSNIKYNFENFEITGNGENTLVETGYYDIENDIIISNISEHGTGTTGNGTHYVEYMTLAGLKLSNAKIGINAHRLNYATHIENCNFDYTLSEYSIKCCHCWSFAFQYNYVRQTAYFYNFVDWVTISNNSFEGRLETYTNGLIIGEGSYTTKIFSNGFDNFSEKAIIIKNECRNLEISNCHFEGNNYAIYNEDTSGIISNIYIHNNWFFKETVGTTAIKMSCLQSSKFELNTFRGNWDYIYDFTGNTVTGNIIYISDSSYKTELLNNINIGRGTIVKYINSNNYGTMQPQEENLTNNYTSESYLKKHLYVDNNIPMCSVTQVAEKEIVIDTFIDSDDKYLCKELLLFNFYVFPSSKVRTYQLTGIISNNKITFFNNDTIQGNYDTTNIELVNNNGKLRITIKNEVHNISYVQGYIKQI